LAHTIVIGIGNPSRRDDGAGIAAVRRLRQLRMDGVVFVECTGDLTTLPNIWQGYNRVILIDAMHWGQKPGEVLRFDASRYLPPSEVRFASTHAFGLVETLALAQALNQLPPSLLLYGIEGKDFADGEGLSPEVEMAVADVVHYIQQDLADDISDA